MPDDPTNQGQQQDDGGKPFDLDALLADNPDAQAAFDAKVTGLKSALKSERERNAELAGGLRDAAAKAGGEAKAQLEEMAGKVEAEAKRAGFYEAAAGAGCTNLKLAFLAAREFDLFDRKGAPDLDALKAQMPELFARPHVPDAKAGAGAASAAAGASNPNAEMNSAIRGALGITV